MNSSSGQAQQGTILGHPKGLFVLFFAEMWERMSYYGMRALLVLYMIKFLFLDPERASQVIGLVEFRNLLGFAEGDHQQYSSKIYGLYTGFAYLTPFFGGMLADRIWGKRKSVYIGGVLMAIGHFLMAFQNLFLFALFFLILGNGAFKPNISTQVGALYPPGDSRRDGAFTIFYMGINLGAFISPYLCKNFAVYLCKVMGWTDPGAAWHVGFTLAGFGMLLGLMAYHAGRKLVPEQPLANPISEHEKKSFLTKTIGGMLLFMTLFVVMLTLPKIIIFIILALVAFGVYKAIQKVPDLIDRQKVGALVILCLGTIAFWAIYEQQGNTLQVWADDKADWAALGLHAENYQSINPMFIFLFAPLLDMWWTIRARKGKKSSSVRKMSIGCFLAGAAFLVIPLAEQFITIDKSLMNLSWLVLTTWVFTMGELYLSPIGLSFVTKVAPAYLMSMMMGMWFLSSFLGNYLAGELGTLYSTMSQSSFFLMFAILGMLVGFFFFFAEKKLQNIVSDV